MGDEVQGHRSTTSKRNPTDKGHQKGRRKADVNATTEEGDFSEFCDFGKFCDNCNFGEFCDNSDICNFGEFVIL